jgi:hypothetical protein
MDILDHYGLSVYTAPDVHVPEEDLRLVLGAEKFAEFQKFCEGRQRSIYGYYPQDVRQFLARRGNLFL